MYAAMGVRSMAGAGRFIDGGVGLGGFAWVAHAAFVLLVLAGIAVLAWALTRKPRATVAVAPSATSAVDAASAIARERLARGEIDPDQYLAIVAALNGQYGVARPPAPSENTSLQG